MIKRDFKYEYVSGKGVFVDNGTYSCKGRLKNKWYKTTKHYFEYSWKKAPEDILAPTCLSTWSK